MQAIVTKIEIPPWSFPCIWVSAMIDNPPLFIYYILKGIFTPSFSHTRGPKAAKNHVNTVTLKYASHFKTS